jgi:DDE family transposase
VAALPDPHRLTFSRFSASEQTTATALGERKRSVCPRLSNWRGEPLRDYETVVRLIAGTTTAKGLKVTCRLDHRKYPVGRKITDEEFAHVKLKPNKFHGEWNYTIHPRN